jgi:hypothetical protein
MVCPSGTRPARVVPAAPEAALRGPRHPVIGAAWRADHGAPPPRRGPGGAAVAPGAALRGGGYDPSRPVYPKATSVIHAPT